MAQREGRLVLVYLTATGCWTAVSDSDDYYDWPEVTGFTGTYIDPEVFLSWESAWDLVANCINDWIFDVGCAYLNRFWGRRLRILLTAAEEASDEEVFECYVAYRRCELQCLRESFTCFRRLMNLESHVLCGVYGGVAAMYRL